MVQTIYHMFCVLVKNSILCVYTAIYKYLFIQMCGSCSSLCDNFPLTFLRLYTPFLGKKLVIRLVIYLLRLVVS